MASSCAATVTVQVTISVLVVTSPPMSSALRRQRGSQPRTLRTKAAALKAAEERIPEMRRKEEERAKARRADRGLKPLRDSEPAGALSNGDGPHTEPSDASEEKEVAPSFWLCCTTMPVEGVLLEAFQHPSIRPQSMLVALHAQQRR